MNRPATAPKNPAPNNSTERLQLRVCAPIKREGKDKVFWHRIGTAWLRSDPDKGYRVGVRLDSVPIDFAGELELFHDVPDGTAAELPFELPRERVQFAVRVPIKREGVDKPFWPRVGTGWLRHDPEKGPRVGVRMDLTPFRFAGELELFEDEPNRTEDAADA